MSDDNRTIIEGKTGKIISPQVLSAQPSGLCCTVCNMQ